MCCLQRCLKHSDVEARQHRCYRMFIVFLPGSHVSSLLPLISHALLFISLARALQARFIELIADGSTVPQGNQTRHRP